jgi:hypothetical protein
MLTGYSPSVTSTGYEDNADKTDSRSNPVTDFGAGIIQVIVVS